MFKKIVFIALFLLSGIAIIKENMQLVLISSGISLCIVALLALRSQYYERRIVIHTRN